MSLMASFCAVLFPTWCLGCDLGLNWVSFWGFFYLLLHSGIAVGSERNESVETVLQKIHERSSIAAPERATRYRRSGLSLTVPWRFVRYPTKLLLRSSVPVAFNTLSWRSERIRREPAIYELCNHNASAMLLPLYLPDATLFVSKMLMTIVTALLPMRL